MDTKYVEKLISGKLNGSEEEVELNEEMFVTREMDDYVIVEEKKYYEMEEEGFVVVSETAPSDEKMSETNEKKEEKEKNEKNINDSSNK